MGGIQGVFRGDQESFWASFMVVEGGSGVVRGLFRVCSGGIQVHFE